MEVPAILPRMLSGVQLSGNLHLAVREWMSSQEPTDDVFAVAGLHAVAAGKSSQLSLSTLPAAAMYLACGIDPARSVVIVQNRLTVHADLCSL